MIVVEDLLARELAGLPRSGWWWPSRDGDRPAANAETMPGVYYTDGQLVAWAGSADGDTWADGHMVEVDIDDLRGEGLDRWDLTEAQVTAALDYLDTEDAR